MEPVKHYTSFEDLKNSKSTVPQPTPSTERQLAELAELAEAFRSNLEPSRDKQLLDGE